MASPLVLFFETIPTGAHPAACAFEVAAVWVRLIIGPNLRTSIQVSQSSCNVVTWGRERSRISAEFWRSSSIPNVPIAAWAQRRITLQTKESRPVLSAIADFVNHRG